MLIWGLLAGGSESRRATLQNEDSSADLDPLGIPWATVPRGQVEARKSLSAAARFCGATRQWNSAHSDSGSALGNQTLVAAAQDNLDKNDWSRKVGILDLTLWLGDGAIAVASGWLISGEPVLVRHPPSPYASHRSSTYVNRDPHIPPDFDMVVHESEPTAPGALIVCSGMLRAYARWTPQQFTLSMLQGSTGYLSHQKAAICEGQALCSPFQYTWPCPPPSNRARVPGIKSLTRPRGSPSPDISGSIHFHPVSIEPLPPTSPGLLVIVSDSTFYFAPVPVSLHRHHAHCEAQPSVSSR
ncbi:hypothetical protein NMY22_g17486 [Coprinellus aureogranulatus]|nr:hypothetical protein NMY22_g17486 [Coprinellus aureogranulatus]